MARPVLQPSPVEDQLLLEAEEEPLPPEDEELLPDEDQLPSDEELEELLLEPEDQLPSGDQLPPEEEGQLLSAMAV